MLLTSQIIATNLVFAGSVSVDLDSLEDAYIKAYGEPTIELGGLIAYAPLNAGPDILPLDTAVDIGASASGGSSVDVPGLGSGGLDLLGRGGMPVGNANVSGFFKGRQNVGTDFTLEARLILSIPGAVLTSPAPAEGLVQGLAMFETLATDGPAIFFGVIQPNGGSKELAIYQRVTTGGALTRLAGLVPASYEGLMLKIVRTGAALAFTYSLDGGTTWLALSAAVGATASSYQVGLFLNNGSQTIADSLNRLVVDSTVLRKGTLGYFTILNAGTALIRSQSPHQFSLDGKVDPEAENKVKGWLTVIRQRLIDAKAALLLQENPVNAATAGLNTEQV
ncbi:MAG: hypothetical protein WC869_00420 [Phycisphaerae bacterium]|jgi:hypothetical protein